MFDNQLVSIITPCYNAARSIEETISSVVNQTYKNWELLIVDDSSTDQSVSIITSYIQQYPNIKLFTFEENLGAAKARNMAIKQASGRYLAFLDADDLWMPDFLEKSLRFVKESEGFVCAGYKRLIDETKVFLDDFIPPKKIAYNDVLKSNAIGCLTAFIDRERLGTEYMPEIRYRQDMGLWLKYLKKIKYAYGNPEVLAQYRIQKKSLSGNKMNLIRHQWTFHRHYLKQSIPKSVYYLTHWAINGYLKYK